MNELKELRRQYYGDNVGDKNAFTIVDVSTQIENSAANIVGEEE